MMNPYMRRRQKKAGDHLSASSARASLKRTLGVPLFQEQLMRIAMVVANFTGGEAEELRRAVGMRRSMATMKDLEVKLRRGMTATALRRRRRSRSFKSISSFALYGFPNRTRQLRSDRVRQRLYQVHYLAAFTCACSTISRWASILRPRLSTMRNVTA